MNKSKEKIKIRNKKRTILNKINLKMWLLYKDTNES